MQRVGMLFLKMLFVWPIFLGHGGLVSSGCDTCSFAGWGRFMNCLNLSIFGRNHFANVFLNIYLPKMLKKYSKNTSGKSIWKILGFFQVNLLKLLAIFKELTALFIIKKFFHHTLTLCIWQSLDKFFYQTCCLFVVV